MGNILFSECIIIVDLKMKLHFWDLCYLIQLWKHQAIVLQHFAYTVNAAGCAYLNIVGFIIITFRSICRPQQSQRL